MHSRAVRPVPGALSGSFLCVAVTQKTIQVPGASEVRPPFSTAAESSPSCVQTRPLVASIHRDVACAVHRELQCGERTRTCGSITPTTACGERRTLSSFLQARTVGFARTAQALHAHNLT